MKILIVCQYFYPEQFRLNDIAFTLSARGHDVTVLTGLPNYPKGVISKEYRWFRKRNEIINGVRVIRVPLIARGSNKLMLAANYLSYALTATIRTIFLKKDYDVVWVYQLSPVTMAIPAIFYKKLTGKKVFLYCNDLWPESVVSANISKNSAVYKILYRLSRWIYGQMDKIAISSRLFDKYFDEILKIKGEREYLPVYAEDIFDSIGKSGGSCECTNLLFAGNIGEMQSVETIIKAAAKLKDCKNIKWHIVGDGSLRIKCEELACKLGLDENIVKFYGHRPLSEMPKFYSIADAFLVTLSGNDIISYTLPNKVQSYMAAGKPIIGAVDGETRLVIEEAGCGLCCKAEDYEGLSEIVKRFTKETENQSLYGRNARKYYDTHFSKERFFDKLLDIFSALK